MAFLRSPSHRIKDRARRGLRSGEYTPIPFPEWLVFEKLEASDISRDNYLKELHKERETALGVVSEAPNPDTKGKEKDFTNQQGSGQPEKGRPFMIRSYIGKNK